MVIPLLLTLTLGEDAAAVLLRQTDALAHRTNGTPVQVADAYGDPGARALVDSARARRERSERLITSYRVTVKQRIGVGIRALRRDRMLFGQEIVAEINWRRDGPSQVLVRGARQRLPVVARGDHVPDDLDDAVEWLVVDPSADYLRALGDDSRDGFSHPLRAGSEADYRFTSGDTTTLTLPDGRVVRVVELRVEPRRAEFRLIAGSFWFDAESFGVVRAVFRPARPFEFRVDAADEDDDVPAWVNPKAEVRYIIIEYGLYDLRWWLPRFWAMDAEGELAGIRIPLRFERLYGDYRVEAGDPPAVGARAPAGSVSRRNRDRDVVADSLRDAPPDSAWPVVVVIPNGDTTALLVSEDLGQPILQMGDVITEHELRTLADEVGGIPQRPWQARVQLPAGWRALLRHARYNRVEALSLGVAGGFDFGRLRVDALGRMGVADIEPNFEVGITRPTTWADWRLGGYHRLAAANPDTRPFSAVASAGALFFGRDDGEYYRTAGIELTGQPGLTRNDWWRVRVYAEQQRAADVETDWSISHAFDGDRRFRPNIAADRADQFGGALTLRGARAFAGASVLAGDLTLEGSAGDYDFGRITAALRAKLGLGRAVLGLELSAGTSTGGVPVQSLWYIGGPATLRGYDGGVLRGEAFWRARAEIGTASPAARLVAFNDWGWAGPRSAFGSARPLVAVGIGGSVLDGLLRADLARGLRDPTGWRFDFYVDGVF